MQQEIQFKLTEKRYVLYYFYLEISARKTTNKLDGELEIDESYFDGERKGQRGRNL